MSRVTQFLSWLEKQARAAYAKHQAECEDCMKGPPVASGQIQVYGTFTPPEKRICVLGGEIHCKHHPERCCWCDMRERTRN